MTTLAPYAVTETNTRGRRVHESKPQHRSEFQRDRDRIIHSAAFRRLEYKTQVFVNHEGDLYRTRLTHSIEVAQIARSIARALSLNEDLTEAIALAHDLGHTPFGHAGQEALNACMEDYGGFEHNLQSLRVVDELEERYAEFPGLNLSFETREGILKHCSTKNAKLLGEIGKRFISNHSPSLEAQVCNLADEIAYNSHDVDDGLRAGFLSLEQLRENPLFRMQHDAVLSAYPELSPRRMIHESIRRLINAQVSDLIDTTQTVLATHPPKNLDAVRQRKNSLVQFSAPMHELNLELKRFLRNHLYRHYRVVRMTTKADRVVRELFGAFFERPGLLPTETAHKAQAYMNSQDAIGCARTVADYIAGMTDRYALKEHQRLYDPKQTT